MLKNLKIERPIVFIDLETTGLSVNSDRIIELTVLKINPDGTEEYKSSRINPDIPIPTSATKVHGITNEDVIDEPKFRQYARSLRDFLENCDFGGFGIKRFDLPLLEAEFKRVGVTFSRQERRIVDSQIIFHTLEPRDLVAAYKKYCDKELKDNHTSEVDVRAAAEVLECQLDKHPELPRNLHELHSFCNPEEANWIDGEGKFIWVDGEAVFDFGQHKGKSLKEVTAIDADYLHWVTTSDFSTEVKALVSSALNGQFPET